MAFDEVSPREWLRRLRQSDADPERNPTIKLLDFFVSKYDNDKVKRAPYYEMANTGSLSPAIMSTPALAPELVSKFIHHFLATSWRMPKAPSDRFYLIVLSGSSSCNLPTVATALSKHYGCDRIAEESIHDAVTSLKLRQGIALSSLDRQIWLSRFSSLMLERLRARELLDVAGMPASTFILTCADLTEEGRNLLRGQLNRAGFSICFAILEGVGGELVPDSGNDHETAQSNQTTRPDFIGVNEVDVLPIDIQDMTSDSIVSLIASAI